MAEAGAGGGASGSGSTLEGTWADRDGTGTLRRAPGEPLVDRTELAAATPRGRVLATIAMLTDAHVLDASSPARVTFLDRLGRPFRSTFRPQEALTAQVLAGAAHAVRALRPDAVVQAGDLIDNAQLNELELALAVLRGGAVQLGSGPAGYHGVQLATNPDPLYYRPDLDEPRHPGLLEAAVRPFTSPGLDAIPVFPLLGDHDILLAGELPRSELVESLALGGEALWELPGGLTVPPGAVLTQGGSPDGPIAPDAIALLLAQALGGPKVKVPPDPRRRLLTVQEAVDRLAAAHGTGSMQARADPSGLDYAFDLGERVRAIALDLARRTGGSGGLVRSGQADWLERQLAAAGQRWLLVFCHHPLENAGGGEELLRLLGEHPRTVAVVIGHTHRNHIRPEPTRNGGYWRIQTASLIDHPQQARALRLRETDGGGVALETWMLDHALPGDGRARLGAGELGAISRELAYQDAQDADPAWFTGAPGDRNVTLYLPPR